MSKGFGRRASVARKAERLAPSQQQHDRRHRQYYSIFAFETHKPATYMGVINSLETLLGSVANQVQGLPLIEGTRGYNRSVLTQLRLVVHDG